MEKHIRWVDNRPYMRKRGFPLTHIADNGPSVSHAEGADFTFVFDPCVRVC